MNNPYREFINFFKTHNLYDKEMFDYLRKNSIQFDYLDDEKHSYIGCHYLTDNNGKLMKIILFVPYIDNFQTLLVNIHEYIHGISLYKKLGKKIKQCKYSEVLPLLYEKIYLLERKDKNLEIFQEILNKRITESSPIDYRIALEVQSEMLHYYQEYSPSFIKLEDKAKRLTRRYKSK